MNEELIDSAWRVLPNEFKEEVKKRYKGCLFTANRYAKVEADLLEEFFGTHNLTSDAEGEEDEMLYVSRKKLQYFYEKLRKVGENHAAFALQSLFGSKCLPDNVDSSELNVDSLPQNPTENCDNKSHISADCNKPAEVKFTKGDMVHCKSFGYEGDYKVLEYTGGPRNCYDCIDKYGAYYRFYESDLEPYTEPTDFGKEVNVPTKKQYRNFAINCDIRPQIAAMAMQGILSNIDLFKNVLETGTETLSGDDISFRAVAKASLLFADALMNEAEKGVEE